MRLGKAFRLQKRVEATIAPKELEPAPVPSSGAITCPSPVLQPSLTSPHHCANCDASLGPVGKRRTTVECGQCRRQTSVYAVLHRCPKCDALLESPLRTREMPVRCPVCEASLQVPTDVLFNDSQVRPDHTWLAFTCPACFLRLQTSPWNVLKEAVCPHCWRTVKIPVAGNSALACRPHTVERNVNDMLTDLHRNCPACNSPVPRQAGVCRHCGEPLA
jgi:hypothetical protein